jgi:hypothetical protein
MRIVSAYETAEVGENQTRIFRDDDADMGKGVAPESIRNLPVLKRIESTFNVEAPVFCIVRIQRFELPVRLVKKSYDAGTEIV